MERGGASFNVHDLDLIGESGVDRGLLRQSVMASLASLHREERWERLVDIALKFTAFSGFVRVKPCATSPLLAKGFHRMVTRIFVN